MTIGSLPRLPLVCLETADFKSTEDVVRGKNTVIGKQRITAAMAECPKFDADTRANDFSSSTF